jgi:ATP-dependent DNA helicase DinG
MDRAARDVLLVAGQPVGNVRLRWIEEAPDGVLLPQWRTALQTIAQACADAQEALDTVSEIAPDFVRLYERATDLLARIARFAGPPQPDAVRWLDAGLQLRLIESPLDIAEAMRTRVLTARKDESGPDGWPVEATSPTSPGRAWIFTSATLGDDDTLSWFTERAGLEGASILKVASPFDYPSQAALYVPRHLPAPADPGHGVALARWVGDAAAVLGGRTLVLTTTLRALRTIGDALTARWGSTGAIEVLVQGDWPKRRLMERFREGSQHGQPGCILVASATFWEGFDVPGDALQLVVIDKLPFPPPGDPLVEARTQRIESAGGKAFKAYVLPEAAVALKQGAGRLIRRETDRGILVVGDTRLVTMGYGKRLLAALPPMRRLESVQEFEEALEALTRTSTTDLPCP